MSQVSLKPESVPVAGHAVLPGQTKQTAAAQSAVVSDSKVDVRWAIVMPSLLAAASLPLLWTHVREMMALSQYEYVPFIALGVAFLAWQRLPGLGTLVPGSLPVFLCLMTLAVAMQLIAVIAFSPVTAMIAFLFAALGLTYGAGGRVLLSRMFPVWLFAWFTVPLPFDFGDRLVASLQRVTAQWSSRLLDTFGIMHLLSGNTVELPGKRLFVEEACSGVQSLFACLAATAFFVIWSHYGYWRSTILLVSAFGWVLVANATRVFMVTWLTTLGIDAISGLPHTLLGLGVFALTLALMFSTDRLLEFFLSHREKFWRRQNEKDEKPVPTHFAPLGETRWASRAAIPLAGIYGAMLLLQLVLLVPSGAVASDSFHGAPPSFALLSEDSLPTSWLGRPRTEYGSEVDRAFKSIHSRYWGYGKGRNRIYVSVDFPFPKWHDLSVCYQGLGWTVDSKLYNPPVKAGDLPIYELEMTQTPMGHGYLIFFLFDPSGEPMVPPSEKLFADLGDRFAERAGRMRQNWQNGGHFVGDDGTSYVQVQVFVSSLSPISEAERAEARRLMTYTHDMLVEMAASARTQQPSNDVAP